MPTLLVVGGGLFGSQAAAYARCKGIEAIVFDSQFPGAASPAAAGLFKEQWIGAKLRAHWQPALHVLETLYGIRQVQLAQADGTLESFLFVPPRDILEKNSRREEITALGDGWVEAAGRRHEGWVYVAAGVWSSRFLPGLQVEGRAGTSFLFAGERPGQIRPLGYGRQALAFPRDPGVTFFSDGTAEANYTQEHEHCTLAHAATLGLTEAPVQRFHGRRPYTPGGPVFQQITSRTWLATGGRKMGTLLGASFAHRLVENELR